ncbi:Uncharacterised protein [Anaerobiospirillum thomasii]|uniref:ATP synthase I chain n=1 Tax=Anaerobiospirillum thomasii TaxID=179995 RepID=A0A2X0WP57_9GAMM|nr:Uncharacterised protein [Anaerobiospirillum thomasii]SPT72287.1 Uncharacterised protein [Anaerobiospirillum thomasii]
MFEPISEDKLYLKKIIIKTIFYDVLFISCICTLICIYAFVFKEPFAVYIKSAVCGCSIFFIADLLSFLVSFKNKNNGLSSGYVLFRVVYGTLFKYFMLVFLFFCAFKFLELNYILMTACFVTSVFFNMIIRFYSAK